MYVTRHQRTEHELLKWLVLILFAGSIVLFLTRPTSGSTPAKYNFFSVEAKHSIGERLRYPTARCIWKVLESHMAADHELAVVQWQLLSVDDDVEVWRSVAMGAAQIQLGELDNAALTLSAHECEDNPVISHLVGVIDRLRAGIALQEGSTEEAADLLHSARQHFGEATRGATKVKKDQPLCATATRFIARGRFETIFPERLLSPRTPTVGDLLAALKLDNFEFKSYVGLAEINISQDLLKDAEFNLDAAVETKVGDVGGLYSTLAKAYEKAGDNVGAARAYLKSTAHGKSKTPPLLRAIRSLRRAL